MTIKRIKRSEFFKITYERKINKYRLLFVDAMSVHFSTKQKATNFGQILLSIQRGKRNGTKNKASTGKIKIHCYPR